MTHCTKSGVEFQLSKSGLPLSSMGLLMDFLNTVAVFNVSLGYPSILLLILSLYFSSSGNIGVFYLATFPEALGR